MGTDGMVDVIDALVAQQAELRGLLASLDASGWARPTGDVAEALGQELEPTERLRLIARLAWRTLPYAFQRAGRDAPGPVAFHLTGPAPELCGIAGRRLDPAATSVRAEGPDAAAVLELVRTYA